MGRGTSVLQTENVQQKALDDAFMQMAQKYPNGFQFSLTRNDAMWSTEFRVYYRKERWGSNPTKQWTAKAAFDDGKIVKANQISDIVFEFEEKVVWPFILGLGDKITGQYPFIRLWADKHLTLGKPLFGKPHNEIPGFVFPKFNGHTPKEFPKHGDYLPMDLGEPIIMPEGTTEVPIQPFSGKPLKERDADVDSKIKYPSLRDGETKRMKNAVKNSKKKVVVKKPVIDPTKVKKPTCAGTAENPHTKGTMEFDSVSQQWRCPTSGCNLVARPKKSADDRSVTIGKGGLQLRLIFSEGGPHVLLVSDDNVAVNITEYVDPKVIMQDFDVPKFADQADEDGKDTFVIDSEKLTTLKMPLTVMGNEEFQSNTDYRKK